MFKQMKQLLFYSIFIMEKRALVFNAHRGHVRTESCNIEGQLEFLPINHTLRFLRSNLKAL